jgi:Ca2+-binding EF-hand superfamily protein
MRFISGMVLSSVVTLVSVAGADALSDQRSAKFRNWDQNRNGVLEKGEYPGHPGNFRGLDDDGNGVLSIAEFVHRAAGAPADDEVVLIAEPVAAPAFESAAGRFGAIDINDDGMVSRVEWAGQDVAFHRADRNGDRVVSWQEYSTRPDANLEEAKFDVLDRNADGALGPGEWPAAGAVAFNVVDRNDDGAVTFFEYIAPPRRADVREERFEDMDHNNDGVLSRREWSGDVGTFNRRDGNRDGVVTWREFREPVAPRQGRFQELDRNNDRRLSRQEWRGDRESFRVLDRSRDGYLSRSEYDDTDRLVDRFRYLDYNKDGILSRQEWRDSAGTFTNLDLDRDGRVSRDEFML